jgi:hypothetical protein
VNLRSVKDDFKRRVCEKIDLQQEGEGRFLVVNPFRFNDGDHYGMVLKKENGHWILTDEASTLTHLSYQLDDEDFESGTRGELIENSLEGLSVQNRQGELIIPVAEDRFGDALFSFVQAITKITDVSYLSRKRVRSTFLEDFRAFMQATVPEDRLSFDWTDELHDKAQRHPVDARVNHMSKPLLVYALPSDEKVKDATISLLTFEKWGIPFRSMAIFEDQGAISRKTLAKFTDVNEKAYSSLEDNKTRIAEYLERILTEELR